MVVEITSSRDFGVRCCIAAIWWKGLPVRAGPARPLKLGAMAGSALAWHREPPPCCAWLLV